MTREGAEVGVEAGLGWGVELEHLLLSGLDQLRMEEDVAAFRDVTFRHAIWRGCHLHGGHHDFVFQPRFAEDEVVRLGDRMGVFECDFHFLADFDVEGFGVVFHACCARRFEGEFEGGTCLSWSCGGTGRV